MTDQERAYVKLMLDFIAQRTPKTKEQQDREADAKMVSMLKDEWAKRQEYRSAYYRSL